MIENCIKFINEKSLCKNKDKILIAVSGGIDSVVMLDVIHKIGYKIGIAHCNFQLREKDSDDDELFVASLAKKYDVDFFVVKFDTKDFAKKNKLSTQMAARDLRYNWFNELINKTDYKYVAIAHNSNDVTETFFINLFRGTGISGITSIKEKNNRIIRPIIFASRNEIEKYSEENNLPFREDKSNSTDDYIRNKIRHHLIPLITEINPSGIDNIQLTIENLKETLILYEEKTRSIIETLTFKRKNILHIKKEELDKTPTKRTILFEIAKDYGFTSKTIDQIIGDLNKQAGTRYLSNNHEITIDREYLLISQRKSNDNVEFLIDESLKTLELPICLSMEFQKADTAISKENNIAYLDFNLLQFPLKLRKWQKGDKFNPLGMKGMKKISDFFSDQKISMPEKQQIWLLVSGEDIVWIINYRIDNKYKITDNTKKILKIVYTEK